VIQPRADCVVEGESKEWWARLPPERSSEMSDESREEGGVTRLSFLKASAAAAAGAAAVGAPVATALAGEKSGVATEPSSGNPPEPVMAYVRDARRGEVTVMSGTSETTYRDRALVKRLLDAAPTETANGGGLDVLAP
jgi:hypothetical protein